MVKRLMKQPLFVTGFLFAFSLLSSSILYHSIYHDAVPKKDLLYGEHHQLIDKAPLSPSQYPPLGTDRQGFGMLQQLLIGAKFTIGGALVISFSRMIVSFFFGIFYGNYLFRFKRFFTGVVDSFGVIPMSLFAYLLLYSVLMMDSWSGQFTYSFWHRVLFEVIVLALIGVPIVSILIGNEIGVNLQKEYIQGARVLGGSRWHIFKKHVMPYLFPRLCIVFVQQTIQVMVIMVHLGLLGLFFGGTQAFHGLGNIEVFSFSNEWSGLIGINRPFLQGNPWLVLEPLVLFTLTIISFSFMLEGLQSSFHANKYKPAKKTRIDSSKGPVLIKDESFIFLRLKDNVK